MGVFFVVITLIENRLIMNTILFAQNRKKYDFIRTPKKWVQP